MSAAALTPSALGARYLPETGWTPTLFVVVDTEEDFDWGAGFSRGNQSVHSMRAVERGQSLLSRYGVKPTYVVDYPIATQPDGYGPLHEIWQSVGCSIGAHLHPWVTPPYEEEVSGPHSYGCNLGATLERRKIDSITRAIAEHFERPVIYKAGRYGFGATTAATIAELGFDVDVSINPTLRPTADEGPSFEAFDSRPFLFGTRRLLELPCTHGYAGWTGALKAPLHRLASGSILSSLHGVGVLSRIGAVNRIMLSPEASTLDEMKAVTRALYREGLRAFSMTFHSPSLEPGHTPYVRTAGDLDRFLDRIAAYCDFFFGDLQGTTSTPPAFRRAVLASQETQG